MQEIEGNKLLVTGGDVVRMLSGFDPNAPVVVDGSISDLTQRIGIEVEIALVDQLTELGVDITGENIRNHCKRVLYPDDPRIICEFIYNEMVILQVLVGKGAETVEIIKTELVTG